MIEWLFSTYIPAYPQSEAAVQKMNPHEIVNSYFANEFRQSDFHQKAPSD